MWKISLIPLIMTLTACSSFKRSSQLKIGAPKGSYEPRNIDTSHYHAPQGPLILDWPVQRISISRGFLDSRKTHHGIDFRGRLNTPIYAAHQGVVVYSGRGFSGYGNMILLEYNKKWATLYAHLNKFNVSTGDIVDKGDTIGFMGSTGRSTGVHLHFELLQKKLPINPMPWLKSH